MPEPAPQSAKGLRQRGLLVLAAIAAIAIVALTIPGRPTPVNHRAPALAPTRAASTAATQALRQVLRDRGPGPVQRLHAPKARTTGGTPNELTTNWAGYVVDDRTGHSYTSVSASWTEPAVQCSPTEDQMAAFWVGLDGFTSSTVEQAGTLAWCYQGSPYHYTWWEMYPAVSIQTVGTAVLPGDRITASVRFDGAAYQLSVRDSTHPANSFTNPQTCTATACLNADAEWIAETPNGARGTWPWPPFGAWQLTGAKATSTTSTGSITTFPASQLIIVGTDGGLLANTTDLNRAGNAFNVAWTHSY